MTNRPTKPKEGQLSKKLIEEGINDVVGCKPCKAVLSFMDDKEEWTGTVGEAFDKLHSIATSNPFVHSSTPKRVPISNNFEKYGGTK